jgi:hypothetical protein
MHSAGEVGAVVADGGLPAEIMAKVIANRRTAGVASANETEELPAGIYRTMAATALATFATLTASYELLFSSQLFA